MRVRKQILKRQITALAVSPAYGTDHQVWTGSVDEGIAISTEMGAPLGPYVTTASLTWRSMTLPCLQSLHARLRTAFVLAGGLFKSTDGGQSWRQVSVSVMQELHRVVFRLLMRQITRCLWARVAVKSKVCCGNQRWRPDVVSGGNLGWCHARAWAIAPNFPASHELLVGDDWGGAYRSTNGGTSWSAGA